MSPINTILSFLIATSLLVFFVPISDWPKRLAGLHVTHTSWATSQLVIAAGLLFYAMGISVSLYLLLAVFCTWAFVVAFLSNRKYLYTLSIMFLVVCPIFLIVQMLETANFSAILCFACLTVGVLQDLFYDKIID